MFTRTIDSVSIQALNKIYQLGGMKFQVLRDITLSVAKGEFVALCGSSGSGKTTMLNLISGIDKPTSGKFLSSWFIDGRFIRSDTSSEAVIGDSIAAVMFEMPLSQSFVMQNNTFNVVGLCLDPINNGFFTFVPLKKLKSLRMDSSPNIVFVQIWSSVDRLSVIKQMQNRLASINPDLMVFELVVTVEKNVGFLSAIWSAVMFLPLFSLVAVSLCLVGYLVLSIDEQHQEFAVLRAIGAKPKDVMAILSTQILIVLFSSFAIGISLGVIITLMILIPQPVVTNSTILEIFAWLLATIAGMFLSSMYPAVRFARKPILKIIS